MSPFCRRSGGVAIRPGTLPATAGADQGHPKIIATLPATTLALFLYGKEQTVRLRSVVALARFLKATPVSAVWCEFSDPDHHTWSLPSSPTAPAKTRRMSRVESYVAASISSISLRSRLLTKSDRAMPLESARALR